MARQLEASGQASTRGVTKTAHVRPRRPEIICGGEGEIDMNNSVPMSNNLLKLPVPQWHAHNGGPYYQSNAGKTEGHRKVAGDI